VDLTGFLHRLLICVLLLGTIGGSRLALRHVVARLSFFVSTIVGGVLGFALVFLQVGTGTSSADTRDSTFVPVLVLFIFAIGRGWGGGRSPLLRLA
jgi:hypothetical protein